MVVSVALAVLVLLIAFLQATQGFFSALIMAVFTICCATAALGTHEWVAVHWLAPHWQPEYAHAIALGGILGIPLIVLRVITDKFVRRSALLPAWVDRAGGGVCGLLTGFILVGVAAYALQMIPFNGSVLGYARVTMSPPDQPADGDQEPPKADAKEQELLLRQDRFALGLASVLSSGIFSGKQRLGIDTPDVVQAVGWNSAVPSEVSHYAPPRSISVVRTEPIQFVYRYLPADRRANRPASFEPLSPQGGYEFHMVRVKLTNEARDLRQSHVFTIRQFRIVGRAHSDDPLEQYHAIAIQQEDETQVTNRHVRLGGRRGNWPVIDKVYQPRDSRVNEVEVVFELPRGFKAEYLEYKRGARAAVTLKEPLETSEASRRQPGTEQTPPPRLASSRSDEPPPSSSDVPSPQRRDRRTRRSATNDLVPDSGRGGNVRGVTTQAGKSSFRDTLPMPLRSYRKLKNVEVSGGKLASGHLVGEVNMQESGTDQPIAGLDVPRDKRLLQLNTARLHAQSGFGRALDFASRTVENYIVEDAAGNRYKVVGKYAIATVNGTRMIEVQYFRDPVGSMGGLGPFDKIKDDDLKGDYEFVLLFLVEPAAEIISFSSGGSASRRDDLRGEGLVAPK